MDNYFTERNIKTTQKIKQMQKFLPEPCNDYLLGIENSSSSLSRLGYCYDMTTFLEFLSRECPKFYGKELTDFTYKDFDLVTDTDLERYLSYLSSFLNSEGKVCSNSEKTKARKFACIRAMFKFFYKKGKISANVTEKVTPPKIHEKEIIRLEVDEVANLLDCVESDKNLTKQQKAFHKVTEKRDIAILTLFLGTGIRISELVGLDISDVDMQQNAFTITRKGGNRVILYFSDEVKKALCNYLQERNQNPMIDKNEKALFLSLQNKRINVRTVEILVKKYSKIVTPLKHITPHKLRSTYGTNLYKETGDIYVVADVLGHKDVNTTKKYYAAITDDIRRNASTKVKLREN
jgi:site-specific recombinase XerD